MPATQSKPTSRPKTMGRFIKRKVNFSVNAKPGAKVFLAGAFNNWDVTKKQMIDREGKGYFTCSCFLIPGTYEYKFYIDGVWCQDVANPNFVATPFNSLNSVVEVI
ncbi:MAG: hypothetical protein GX937_06705 [Lentisphaerae bacterium]|jgi:1,4-alpha-glucan branching enzyme|nr:hypothetical protein [Lentisphaerota bacterium]